MKKLLYILSLILIVSSCSSEKRHKIGVSQCSRDDWRLLLNEELEREVLFHTDMDLEILSADNNSQHQIADLEYFVKNKFDLIMVCPNEAEALTPIIKRIHDIGIPVIVFDRNTSEKCYSAYISADNERIGEQAAEYLLAHKEGDLNIVELFGVQGSLPSERRSKGFHRGIAKDSVRAKILNTEICGWATVIAQKKVDSLIKAGVDFNVIYAHNDRMALGASDALEEHGLRDKVTIIGVDGVPSIGIQAVKDGLIDATFYYPTGGLLMMETALRLLHDKTYFIDTILPSPNAVDKENAAMILEVNSKIDNENSRLKTLKDAMEKYVQSRAMRNDIIYFGSAIFVLLIVAIYLAIQLIRVKRNKGREIERLRQDFKYRRAQLESELQELRGLHNPLADTEDL